ncbi:MAG: hypothetical protein ACPGU1_22305 [Myxococcota bacterium]
MKHCATILTLAALTFSAAMPAFASEESEPESAEALTYAAEVLTDFPIHMGAGARVEFPLGLRVHTSLGVMPGPYLETINALCTEMGWYDQLTADLISAALENSLVWRLRASWRPLSDYGFYVGAGYSLATLGGGLSGAEVIAAASGVTLPDQVEGKLNFETAAAVHMLDAEVGWELLFFDHLLLRLALGGTFTVDAATTLEAGWQVSKPTQAKVDELALAGELYLDDIITRYVHALTLTVALGWQF